MQLTSTFSFKMSPQYHMPSSTCRRVILISKCLLTCPSFFHKSKYLSNFKLCWLKCIASFCMSGVKSLQKLSKIHTSGKRKSQILHPTFKRGSKIMSQRALHRKSSQRRVELMISSLFEETSHIILTTLFFYGHPTGSSRDAIVVKFNNIINEI